MDRRDSQSIADSFVTLAESSEREAAAAHRRRRSRSARRSVDAHQGRETRHPRDQAGARARHARRERWHGRPVDHRFQADGPPRRRRGKPGFPGRDAAADGRMRLSAIDASPRRAIIRFIASALGIGADAILIGAFVTALKLSRRCLWLWREVLARIPRAQLVFSPMNPALRDAYVRIAAAAGIARGATLLRAAGARRRAESGALRAHRLRARPDAVRRRERHAGGARHGRAGRHAGRQASRRALGVFDPREPRRDATRSRKPESEYVEIACRLATDPRLHERGALRDPLATRRRRRSPIGASYTRSLERAYVAALSAKAPDVATTA